MIDEPDVERVMEILRELEPEIKSMISVMMEKEGSAVTLSVLSNVATGMLALCSMIVLSKQGDVEQYATLMAEHINEKFEFQKSMNVPIH